jgi:glycosyltransferase involved in cell wall biosynthesis
MRIILIPSSVEPVGVATHVLNLARLIKRADLLDVVACPTEGWLSEQLQQEDIPFHILHISYKSSFQVLYANFVLYQFLKKRKSAKIVHLHGRFPLFISLLSMITLKRLQFVVTVHQFYATATAGLFEWKNRLETFVWKHLVKSISCVSEALTEEVIKRLGSRFSDKVFVIKNWIQPAGGCHLFRRETFMNEEKNQFKIIAIGRLSKEKGFDILIDAVRILTERGSQVRCDIFGDGPEKARLALQISDHNLGSIIKLRGISDKVRYFMPLYDLLVVPSRMESFGIVILEAYDASIPVVASNVPGLNEIVKRGETGLLFVPGNAESLAQQIIYLINFSELRNSLAKQGKEFVKMFYPSEELLNQYLKFYGFQNE